MAIPSGPGQFVVGASCAIAAVTIAAGWRVMTRLGVTTRLSAPDLTALRFPIGKAALSADDDVRKRPAYCRALEHTASSRTRTLLMTDMILHHYETSPYAEKVRLGLGLKGLAWASVEIPVIMPKPDLTALTGGYRKTPVLQIGADLYCDSQLIVRELERRHPSPSFYPVGRRAADALAWWAEKTMFSPAVSIVFAKRPDTLRSRPSRWCKSGWSLRWTSVRP